MPITILNPIDFIKLIKTYMLAITDTEITQKGLGALVEALGEVDAERFITLLNREPFDYTAWQKDLFSNLDVHEISTHAMRVREQLEEE